RADKNFSPFFTGRAHACSGPQSGSARGASADLTGAARSGMGAGESGLQAESHGASQVAGSDSLECFANEDLRGAETRDRLCVGWHQALAAPPALVAESLKDLVFILEAEDRSECRPRERLAHHLSTVPEDETRAVSET